MLSQSPRRLSGDSKVGDMGRQRRCLTVVLLVCSAMGSLGLKKRQVPPFQGHLSQLQDQQSVTQGHHLAQNQAQIFQSQLPVLQSQVPVLQGQVPALQGQVVVQGQQDPRSQPTVVQAAPAKSPLAAVHAQAKFFQYMHLPKKNHYETGHRQGSDHHFVERHDKARPESGEFKTKVRWGDKHGGYGEHYWDFNHAGHGGDNHDESSDNVHEYDEYDGENNRNKRNSKHHPEHYRQPETHNVSEQENAETKPKYRTEPQYSPSEHQSKTLEVHQDQPYSKYSKEETEELKPENHHNSPNRKRKETNQRLKKEVIKAELYLDESTGRIFDKSTGQSYVLQPV